MKILKPALTLFCLLSLPVALAEEARPLNIIFVIGDGMGMEYLAAHRQMRDNPATPELEQTLFDAWLVGTSGTHPHDPSEVTDSAASGTALSAGIKTYNGAIGVDIEKQPVETLLERAKKQGYSTAMVATSQINHATPASFAAHVDSRHKYNDIADQYLDNRFQERPWVDVLIGGGTRYFIREDRDLVAEFEALGYRYADTFADLKRLTRAPALALLAPSGLPHAIDSEPANRLAIMIRKALELMPTERPFFMLVEASQIDWCGHANDIACAMAEMADAEAALGVIKGYVDSHANTLVVVTADHSTGGLSMGADGEYAWRAGVIKKIQASAGKIVDSLINAEGEWYSQWQTLTSLTLTEGVRAEMGATVNRAVGAETDAERKAAKQRLRAQVLQHIDNASGTGWTTSGHTGGDVPIMVYGTGAEHFKGYLDNTEIARRLFALLPQ